jgi:hypothetical protein
MVSQIFTLRDVTWLFGLARLSMKEWKNGCIRDDERPQVPLMFDDNMTKAKGGPVPSHPAWTCDS